MASTVTATTSSTTSTSNGSSHDAPPCSNTAPRGSIVVVAKCPIPGKSKTRLIPLLGAEGSVVLAKAMLSDVLTTLTECEELAQVEKILLYAPPTEEGARIMEALLQELGLSSSSSSSSSEQQKQWILRPMMAADNLLSSNLGSQLTQALIETRRLYQPHQSSSSTEQHQQQHKQQQSVVFLGMDAPELPLDEIVAALTSTESMNDDSNNHYDKNHAHLCPAADGGYGMLSVPANAPAEAVFRNVVWSDPLTALSQIKALTDCTLTGVNVRVGRIMHDVDEATDVKALCERLKLRHQEGDVAVEVVVPTDTDTFSATPPNDTNNLQVQSASAAAVTGAKPQTGNCRFARKALMQLGQL